MGSLPRSRYIGRFGIYFHIFCIFDILARDPSHFGCSSSTLGDPFGPKFAHANYILLESLDPFQLACFVYYVPRNHTLLLFAIFVISAFERDTRLIIPLSGPRAPPEPGFGDAFPRSDSL